MINRILLATAVLFVAGCSKLPEQPPKSVELTGNDQMRYDVNAFEAKPGQEGKPTPEGMHRDGVDYVLVLLIDRTNIESGTTTIHAHDGSLLGSFTLTHALDAALVDDARVFHGVTAVTPLDPARPAHRDVLVVTFRALT